jgi:hypothetical protein
VLLVVLGAVELLTAIATLILLSMMWLDVTERTLEMKKLLTELHSVQVRVAWSLNA